MCNLSCCLRRALRYVDRGDSPEMREIIQAELREAQRILEVHAHCEAAKVVGADTVKTLPQ